MRPRHRESLPGRLPRARDELLTRHVRIDSDRILAPDGFFVGVLVCEEIDVLALEPWRREAAVDALETLLRSLEAELVLTVHSRRSRPATEREPDDANRVSTPASAPAGGGPLSTAALRVALDQHWSERLERQPAYHRAVSAMIRDPDAELMERQLALTSEALTAAGIEAQRLTGRALGAHLAEAGLDLPRLAWAGGVRQAWVGDRVVRTALLDRLPGGHVGAGWLAALVRCPAEADIALHLVPTPGAVASRLLGHRLRHLGAHQLLEAERGLVPDAAVETGLLAARSLRDRLARNTGRPLRLWLTAVALGTEAAAPEQSWGRLCSAFAATSGRSRPGHFEHLEGAIAAWGLGRPAGPGKLVDSHAAASCIPWLQTSIDDPGGYRIGRMADSGLPVALAPFDESRHVNANVGIFAASGQGKSFLIGGLLVEARRLGVDALVVDPEGEYRDLVTRLGGRWLDLVSEAAINPFDLGGDDAGGAQTVVDACAELCAGMTEEERAAVEAAAHGVQVAARERGDRPRLRGCVEPLSRSAPRVARVLGRHLDGALAGFLDRPTSSAWTHPLLAVGHREVREELVPVTTLLLGRMLWELVRRLPRRRHIVLDEVGMLSAHPALRQLLAQLARRCRKYGSSLVVATQNVQDLLRSEEGTVVASNCAVVFCGGHRAVEVAAMERAFALTEAHQRRLERSPRGEFVLLAGSRRGVVQVDLPEAYGTMIRGGKPKATP
ncbi:MAG TPA: DUF87 domain-containing protein [Candidatus Binatia bacterium]|nr:DUF87 domain-containing protein [Candidatus Binatia bacterium]